MVMLEFERMPEVIAEARERDLRLESCFSVAFEMRVRFNVGGVELFRRRPDFGGAPYAWLQVHEFAAYGALVLRAAKRKGRGRYNFIDTGDYVDFEMDGDDILVSSSMEPTPVRVSFAELQHAWDRFSDEVRAYLRQETPELEENPFWGAWLRGAWVEDLPPYFPREDR